MIRLVAFDLDNTLLNDEKEVTEKNRLAVEQAVAQGVKVILCSGRGRNGMAATARKLGVFDRGDYMISDNGAVVTDTKTGEIVYQNPLTKEQIAWIVDQGRKNPQWWNVQVYNTEDVHVERRDGTTEHYESLVKVHVKTVDNLEDLYDKNVMKAVFIAKNIPELDKEKERLSKILPEGISMFKSASMLLEFIADTTSKGKAVAWVAEKYGVSMEEVLCMGDNENDISMLEMAGVAATPASGLPSVKKVCDYVAEADHNHDAAAEVLEKFVLGEKL